MSYPLHLDMKKSSYAFTLIELLVVISIIGILAALALPALFGALAKGQMTQTLSNMKQLHLATQQMALDGTTTGDATLSWPGDSANVSWAAMGYKSRSLLSEHKRLQQIAECSRASPGLPAPPRTRK